MNVPVLRVGVVPELAAAIRTAEDVAEYADRVLVLHDHRLVRQGTVREIFNQIDYLKSIGIGVPQITDVTEKLRLSGFPIEHAAITVDEAEKMILEVLQKRKGERR